MSGREKFSGWKVLTGCILCMFLVQGCVQCFSIYMPQIAAETGWGVYRVAVVSSTAAGGAFIANLLLTPALKRLSAKTVLAVGALFLVVHMCLYSVCTNVYLLWLAGLLGGVAIGWGTAAPCSILISNWFVKNRSQYIAAAVAGSMFGSVLQNPAAALLIERLGWRSAYVVQSVTVGGLALASVLFLISESPEKKGQKPYGAEQTAASAVVASGGVEIEAAKRSLSYPLLALGIFLIGLSTNTENYMPAFWQSRGLAPVLSSWVMSAYSLFAALSSVLMSRINDRLGGRNYVLLTTLLFSASLLVMTYTGVVSSLPWLILCCIPFAAGAKKSSILIPPLVVAETFGPKHYSSLIGLFAAMLQLGITASNFVIGPLLRWGYSISFSAMAAVNIAGMACVFLAMLKKPYRTEICK